MITFYALVKRQYTLTRTEQQECIKGLNKINRQNGVLVEYTWKYLPDKYKEIIDITPASREQHWNKLSDDLTIIYSDPQHLVSTKEYMNLYSRVYQFYKSPNMEKTNRLMDDHGYSELLGSDLYDRLKKFISYFVGKLLVTCKDQAGNQLLEKYMTLWKQFQCSSTVVDKIFSYLNRHWIKHELDEGHQDIYEVYNNMLS
uniref:Cullin N-terminal domain-containing protein n=1 Tax=Acrobeloides nanus TaxID=290746 RepID=A0A914CM38_9BILA